MSSQKVLLRLNFTYRDRKALDFIIDSYAHRKDIEISLFFTYEPLPEIEMRDSPTLNRMSAPLSYLAQKKNEQEEALETAKGYLLQGGFSDDQVSYVTIKKEKNLPRQLVKTISDGQYNVLV
jgi:hypothetical protein